MPNTGRMVGLARRRRPFDASKHYAIGTFAPANYYGTSAGGGEVGDAAGFGGANLFLLTGLPGSGSVGELLACWSATNGYQAALYNPATPGINFLLQGTGGGTATARPLLGSEIGRLFLAVFQHSGSQAYQYVDRAIVPGALLGSSAWTPASTAATRIGLRNDGTGPLGNLGLWLAGMTWRGVPSATQLAALFDLVRTLGDVPSEAAAEAILTAPSVGDAAITALAPVTWLRADSFTESGGKVTAFVDKMRPAHLMVQATAANQVPTPTADAAFNNQLSAVFTAASVHYYTSNLPSTDWAFANTGPLEVFFVYTSTGTGSQLLLGTRAAATAAETGFALSRASATVYGYIGNGTATQPQTGTVGTHATNVATYLNWRHSAATAPNMVLDVLDGTTFRGTFVGALGGTTPQFTLSLGARATGVLPADMRFVDALIFNRVLSDSERQTVRDYIASRYRFYGYTLGVSHRTSLRDELLKGARGALVSGQVAPRALPDTVTGASLDEMVRTGFPVIRVIDPAAYPRTTHGAHGFHTSAGLFGATGAGLVGNASGFWGVLGWRCDRITANAQMIAHWGNSSASHWAVQVVSSGLRLLVRSNNGTLTATVVPLVAATDVGVTEPLLFNLEGSVFRLYRRNVVIAEITGVTYTPNLSGQLALGLASGNVQPLESTLFDFMGGDGTLTAEQIAQVFSEHARVGKLVAPTGANVLHYYDLTQDIDANGGPQNGIPATVQDRVGTAHLTRSITGLQMVTQGSAQGLRNFATLLSYAVTGGGFAGTAAALWASVLFTPQSLTGIRVLFGKSNHSNAGWYIYLGGAWLGVYVADQNGVLQQGPQVQLTAGQLGSMMHVALRLTGGFLSGFLNGASMGSPVAITGYTPSAMSMTLGATNGGSTYGASNVDFWGAEGGNFAPTDGEIATAAADSLATGTIAAIAAKTSHRYDLKADIAAAGGGVPLALAERISGVDRLTVVDHKLEVGRRTERLWSYETQPIFRGLDGWADANHYQSTFNDTISTNAGWWWSLLVWVPAATVTSNILIGARSTSPGTSGFDIRAAANNTSFNWFMGDGSAFNSSGNAVAALDRVNLFVGVWDAAAMRQRTYTKRGELGSGTVRTGYSPASTVKIGIGREPSLGAGNAQPQRNVLGFAMGQGIPTYAQVMAHFDHVQASEAMQTIPGLPASLLVDTTLDIAAAGNTVPASLANRGSVGGTFTRTGSPTLTATHARAWSW